MRLGDGWRHGCSSCIGAVCIGAVLLTLTAACGGLPAVPSEGGPTWTRVRTEHFVLYTDLDADAAGDTAVKLERLLAGFVEAIWRGRGMPAGQIRVVLFNKRAHFKQFAPEAAGYFIEETLCDPLVVAFDAGSQATWSTLNHELTHYIADRLIRNQPPWFAEGLAKYFESAHIQGNELVLGRWTEAQKQALRAHILGRDVAPLSELLAAERPELTSRFYTTSWMLFQYLFTSRNNNFNQYLAALIKGEPFDKALTSAFGPIPELQREFNRFTRRGIVPVVARPITPRSIVAQAETLRDADVYALRAMLYNSCFDCERARGEAEAVRYLKLALSAEPTHVIANALADQMDRPRAASHAEVAKGHPEDWLAWFGLAGRLVDDNPRSEAHQQAVERSLKLNPGHPHVLLAAARLDLLNGDNDSALEHAIAAFRARPRAPRVLVGTGWVLASSGYCDELSHVHRRLKVGRHGHVPIQAHALLMQQRNVCTQMAEQQQARANEATSGG